MTDRTRIEALLGAYALDALDADERAEIEAFLEHDPGLRKEVDEHRAVAGILAEAVETAPSTPSPMVWQRIEEAIGGADAGEIPKLRPVRSPRRSWSFRLAAAVAGAAVVASAVLAVQVVDQQRRIDELAGADRLREAAEDLVASGRAEVVTLTSDSGAVAQVAIGDDGVGFLVEDSLPPLPEDRTYQLWAIVDDRVISAGVLGNDPDLAPFQVVGELAGLAITEEIAGGVVSSENPAVALWVREG